MLEKEQQRLASGWTYEPTTVYEKNPQALEEGRFSHTGLKRKLAEIRWATGEPSPAAGIK
jgi:hypothetical protein